MVLRQRAASLMASLTLATAAATFPYEQETRSIIPRNHHVDESEGRENKRGPLAKTLFDFEQETHPIKGFNAEEFELQSSSGKLWTQQRDRRGFEDLPHFGDRQGSGSESQASLRGGLWGGEHSETTAEESAGFVSEGSSTWEEALLGVFDSLWKWLGGLRFLWGMGWPVRVRGKETARVEPWRMGEEVQGFIKSERRRLQTSADNDVVTYDIEVVMTTGNSSTDWKDAEYTLVFDTVFEQDAVYGEEIGSGTIDSDEDPPISESYSLERGCYNLYTTAGTRPYDVLWEVRMDGELYEDAQGGGSDRHIFGVGGALCELSTCYKECYNAAEDLSTNACASLGDLLAPLTETNGAQCECDSDEELELRLACLSRGCTSNSQCYLHNTEATIIKASTLRIITYILLPGSGSFLVKTAVESAMAQWLDFDSDYVELTEVDGNDAEFATITSRARNLEEAYHEGALGITTPKAEQSRAEGRKLQSGTFTRLEFLIISEDLDDFTDAETTINAGIRGFNTVLGVQDDSGLASAQAYTVDYVIASEYVAAADVPEGSIAGTGSQGATEAPAESSSADFTRETQFLVGAGLVVVVSFALSIVACVVCYMKRKERREFQKKNEPINGRPRPVEYVDPWGSVTRTLQNDTRSENKTVTTASETVNGHHSANGSQTYSSRGSKSSFAQ